MNEKELIQQAIIGNEQAFRFLIKKYERLVFHIAGRVTGPTDELNDICQDVFIKIYKRLPLFRSESKLSTWIATIAYRTAIDFVSKKRVDTEELNNDILPDEYIRDTKKDPEHISIKEEQKKMLHATINRLPKKYKSVLNMFYLEEFSIKEIEKITEMPAGTVKNYIFRARNLLKDELLKHQEFKEVKYEN